MKKKRIITSKSLPAIVALLATSSLSNAATISWNFTEIINTGGAQGTMGVGFLDATGTLLFAENSGGVAAVVDTIPLAAGSFSVGGASGNAFHSSDPVLDSGTFGTNGNGTNATGVDTSIGNDSDAATTTDIPVTLTVGNQYRIQIVAADGRGTATARSHSFDGNATDHALGVSGSTWGNSLLTTGTFTADDTFQVFNSQLFNNGGARNDTQFNAVIIHDLGPVPEPSSALLVGLAGVGFLVRRRK